MAKIDDVARLAGVSKGTVSNVFSQKRPTSKKVTERVLQISKELNYVPNHIARSLVTKKTMAIGLTIPHRKFFFSMFHNQFINGVLLEASRYGYRVLLDMIATEEIKTPSLASFPIDGAIVLGPTEEDPRINLLHRHDIPFVTIGRVMNEGMEDVPTVNNDNRQIMREICEHLIGLGHRNIMFLNAGKRMTVAKERLEEFMQSMETHDIAVTPDMIFDKPDIQSDKYMSYGYDETLQMLQHHQGRVTAIIADDDRAAINALHAINDAGLSVPEDISLFMICGDLSTTHQVRPSLTGMDLQASELGVQSVRLLMHKLGVLEGEYEDNWVVPSKFIEGSSCSAITEP
ncbi:LacI family DNA-binding transcriptional regulator [Paenibacillus sp. GCM10012306]|uniref:LacI family DNA-binding transcriptional regulator n=1 Tax=Paenibacillus sp. GCM10012306 TaxID=3317342 RepID=UPI00361432D8